MTINVLHLIDSGGLYGAEMMLLNLVEEQLKVGFNSLIISVGTLDIQEKALELEAKNRGLPIKPYRMRSGFNIIKLLNIISFAKKNNFHILHSHGYKFNILLGILPNCLRKLPVVTTIHGYIPEKKFSKLSLYQWLDCHLANNLDHVVFVNESMLNKDIYKKIIAKKSVINNGININRENSLIKQQLNFKPSSEIKKFIDSGNPLLGFIGRLSYEKGLQDLLLAFSSIQNDIPGVKLLVIGEGPYKYELINLIKNSRLDSSVMFIGYSSSIRYYLSKINLLVLPSHTEGLPIVLLEAMFSECMILATSVGGMPEVLQHGKLGFLTPPENKNRLAIKLDKICQMIKKGEKFTEIKQKLKHEIINRYSSKQMSDGYRAIYCDVLKIQSE